MDTIDEETCAEFWVQEHGCLFDGLFGERPQLSWQIVKDCSVCPFLSSPNSFGDVSLEARDGISTEEDDSVTPFGEFVDGSHCIFSRYLEDLSSVSQSGTKVSVDRSFIPIFLRKISLLTGRTFLSVSLEEVSVVGVSITVLAINGI